MDAYITARERLIADAAPGSGAARQLSSLTDEAVREIALAASSCLSKRWSLLALGGWGRELLLPESDLDLLVLSEEPESKLKPFVEQVLYPLWDAGLKVGHQVRSPGEQAAAMRQDLKTCTAALSARPFAGDVVWAEATAVNWARDAAKRKRRLTAELHSRPRPGTPYLLEPDLKSGMGGRRDYDELLWLACLSTRAPLAELEALVRSGILTRAAVQCLNEDAEVTLAARWELQLGGSGDRMSSESATEFRHSSAERIQLALARTAHSLDDVRASVHASTPTPLSAEKVFALLDPRGGDPIMLEHAAQNGCLDHLIPGFSSLMTARRPGLGHELTVGAHSLAAAGLAAGPPDDDRALAHSHESVTDLRPLLVAALAHDIGKLDGSADHATLGAEPARQVAHRFGLGDDDAALVSDIVKRHLLLAQTALHQNIDDEDVLLRCAASLGRLELLAPLHVLTWADSRATGASRWTPWSASLIGSLVSRLDRILGSENRLSVVSEAAQSVKNDVLGRFESSAPEARQFVESAPLGYLASRTADAVARHALLVAEVAQRGAVSGVAVEVSPGPVADTLSVTVCTPDRPELLARLSGAISLAGLDILSVDAYLAAHDVALDCFVVKSATERKLGEDVLARMERLMNAAMRDRLELRVRLQERQRHYPARAAVSPEVTIVQLGWATELRLTAADRPGLLHDVAQAVAASGLDIRWATVQTIEGVAQDVFHITGEDGAPAQDPGLLGHVVMRVREAL